MKARPFALVAAVLCALTAGSLVFSAASAAAGVASWSPTGSMSTGRVGFALTGLLDGRVVVSGGLLDRDGSTLTGTELYNPATGRWSVTGSMAVARFGHTSTLLANGKVLAVGGRTSSATVDPTASAELYDPSTGRWSPTGSLHVARSSAEAVRLRNGKVLLLGHEAGDGPPLVSTELYDPSTGTWTLSGSLTTDRTDMQATLLADGKVLASGGRSGSDSVFTDLRSAELYDPATGLWTPVDNMKSSRVVHTATLLRNGKVLVAGGAGGGQFVTEAELFDPITRSWTTTGTMLNPRFAHIAALLGTGQVLVAGGCCAGNQPSDSAELYDPLTGAWTHTADMTMSRDNMRSAVLPNGQVLVVGGHRDQSTTTASAELYTPAPPPPTLVVDSFTRNVATGWGSPQIGGAYALQGPSTLYAVQDGQGEMTMRARTGGAALLPSVSAVDVDMRVDVATDSPPAGGEQYAYLVARSVGNDSEYRAQLRIGLGGIVTLRVARAHLNQETQLGRVRLPDLQSAVGTPVSLRFRVTGTNPTTLQFKEWTGRGEPPGWTLTKTDATAELQTAGAVGLRCYLPASTTNGPVRFSFTNFTVTG